MFVIFYVHGSVHHKSILINVQLDATIYNLATLEWGSCIDIWLVPVAVVTVLCTPDDGRGRHPKHIEWYCSKIKYRLHIVTSRTFINRVNLNTCLWTGLHSLLVNQKLEMKYSRTSVCIDVFCCLYA